MPQNINRFHKSLGESQPSRIEKDALIIPRGALNKEDTTITLTGTDSTNYSKDVLEPYAWILGNFAHSDKPAYPIFGQTWFDTSSNEVKLYIGEDYSNQNYDWFPIKRITYQDFDEDLIPDTPSFYDIGAVGNEWSELHVDSVIAHSDFFVDGIKLQDLLPSDSSHILNVSMAPGYTVADALTIFNGGASASVPITITIIDEGPISIVPAFNTRYRITSDIDIEITIEQTTGVEGFSIFAAGLGNFKIIPGTGVNIQTSKAGEYVSSSYLRNNGLNSWFAFANFGDY